MARAAPSICLVLLAVLAAASGADASFGLRTALHGGFGFGGYNGYNGYAAPAFGLGGAGFAGPGFGVGGFGLGGVGFGALGGAGFGGIGYAAPLGGLVEESYRVTPLVTRTLYQPPQVYTRDTVYTPGVSRVQNVALPAVNSYATYAPGYSYAGGFDGLGLDYGFGGGFGGALGYGGGLGYY